MPKVLHAFWWYTYCVHLCNVVSGSGWKWVFRKLWILLFTMGNPCWFIFHMWKYELQGFMVSKLNSFPLILPPSSPPPLFWLLWYTFLFKYMPPLLCSLWNPFPFLIFLLFGALQLPKAELFGSKQMISWFPHTRVIDSPDGYLRSLACPFSELDP